MSRAIGDTIARDIGVIPHPDVASHQVTPRDKFLVFASDGVWEYLDGQQVTTLVGEELEVGGYSAVYNNEMYADSVGTH